MPTLPFVNTFRPDELVVSPPANVEVAVVEVAWKYSATTGPTTLNFA